MQEDDITEICVRCYQHPPLILRHCQHSRVLEVVLNLSHGRYVKAHPAKHASCLLAYARVNQKARLCHLQLTR